MTPAYKAEFTVTPVQLAKAHGVTTTCIGAWAKGGSFPWALRGANRRMFHVDCLKFTGGEIKSNLRAGLFKSPMFFIDAPVLDAPEGDLLLKLDKILKGIFRINNRLDAIDIKLGINTAVVDHSELRNDLPGRPTVAL